MIRVGWRWLKRLLLLGVVAIIGLLAPVGYIELACRGAPVEDTYAAILPEAAHRPEARTLLTYPEWHIVHAYDDYAQVIATADPHRYQYLRSVGGFWSSLCALSRQSARHGGFDTATKQMAYTVGVSFTAELLAKAAYEETLGRMATMIRGDARAPLDDLSAQQAAAYAGFLQQVPWYKWDFARDRAQLAQAATPVFRDRERRFALGVEYAVKAAYAGVIEQAVAQVGADDLRLRMIVTGLSAEALSNLPGVVVMATRPQGIEIETPRYRALTDLLQTMAEQGGTFIEIAGNDDIMFTALAATGMSATDNLEGATSEGAIFSFARQGYGDWRHLMLVKVGDLAEILRTGGARGVHVEHIHDY